MGTSSRRSDEWWQERYAKSQQRIEDTRAEHDRTAMLGEPQLPFVPAVSTGSGPDGAQYMFRLIPPGEPLDHVGRFAIAATIVSMLTRGGVTHRVDNPAWIAAIERQRGPWRGYERVEVRHFERYPEAARFLLDAKQRVQAATSSTVGSPVEGEQ